MNNWELPTGGPRRGLPGRSGASLRALPREGMTRTDPSER